MSTRRRAPGFTLMELLIVMSILTVLLLVALPVFNYVTGARSTESGINLASAMLGRARALALSRTDDKYIGVLFYTQADGDRDAMQIVEVDAVDASSQLERYISWQNNATYQAANTTPGSERPADVVYGQSLDPLTGSNLPFTNRPVVKRYISKVTPNQGNKPPNGTPAVVNGVNTMTFTDNFWDNVLLGNTAPVTLDAEVQYMPRGVRAAVILNLPGNPTKPPIRTPALVLFDKQGRVTQHQWGIAHDNNPGIDGGEKLLDAMGVTTDMPISKDRVSGVAITVFNEADVDRTVVPDLKDRTAVNDWAYDNADQYTVGIQSGELLKGPQN